MLEKYKLNYVIFLWVVIYSVLMHDSATASEDDDVDSLEIESDICYSVDSDNLETEELIPEVERDSIFSFLDSPQEYISSGVESFALSLDEFFSEDKVFYRSSGTYLRIRADFIRDENGDYKSAGDIRLKLRLPNTKKKLKLTFESDADERQDDDKTQEIETQANSVENKEYFTGLQLTLGDEHGWQLKPSLGLRLSSSIEPYIRLRARRRFLFKKWSIYWAETAYWFDSTGTGLDSLLEFNRKITNRDLFRIGTTARWTNENDYTELGQTFTMFHTFSKRRALSYYIGAYGINEPTTHETHYLAGLTYRQNIHKDYLFFEIIPQYKYQKINNFESEFSLLFRLEMIFRK